jgi:hypothetical protein
VTRTRWAQTPNAVRQAVTAALGRVHAAVDVEGGDNADLTTVVTGEHGRAFVKAVAGISRTMRFLRNEITANPAAAPLAPAVLFAVDVDADDGTPWLVVGTEYIDGRPARLAPGSPDLDIVGAAVEAIAALPAPDDLWPLARRWKAVDLWERAAERSPDAVAGFDVAAMTRLCEPVPGLVDGDRLVHTDLHADQFLITGDAVRVIDWGYPCAGAAWVDTALMVLRLIIAGHRPADAEAWGRSLSTFRDVEPAVLDSFAVHTAALWLHLAHLRTPSGWAVRNRAALGWAAWRLQQRNDRALV